jgi:hypothetical protein
MRIIRNDKFIKQRASLGRNISIAGLVILVIGLLISFSAPQLFLLSFLCLLIGFLCSQVGIYLANRYIRIDRPDEVLQKALKGFDDRYALYLYTSPAGNVFLTPTKCVVFTVKLQSGPIEYRAGKWHHRTGGLKRLFGWMTQEGLGNPTRDAETENASLQRYITKKLPDVEVAIQPVIVFSSPTAELNTAGAPIPAIHAKKLKEWLRSTGKAGGFTAETHDKLAEILEAQGTTTKSISSASAEES